MKPDQKVTSTRLHKNFLRRFIKDERLSSDLRFAAELFLMRIEGAAPVELVDSILLERYGSPTRISRKNINESVEINTVLDNRASQALKDQWKNIISEENDTRITDTNPTNTDSNPLNP